MSQESENILRARSLLNRNLYQQKISDAAEAQTELPSPTNYLNFDAESGLARLRDNNGSISYGSAQTNGAVGLGDNIRLRRGGVLAGYDAMPRRKSQAATISESIEELEAAFLFYIRASSQFENTGAYFRRIVFFESIQQIGYGEAANSFTHTIIRQIEPLQVTYEDEFTTSFRHTGADNYLAFGNVSSNSGQIFSNGPPPVRFFSPTEAKLIVNINFGPGGGVISTHCGISIDRQVGFVEEDYLEPGQSIAVSKKLTIVADTCDAYSSGTSVSHEAIVPAGEHFITCVGCYSFTYPIKGNSSNDFIYSESFSGSISITVETTAANTFYLQKGNRITKLEDVVTERINNTIGSLVGYITATKSKVLAHIKYRHPIQSNNQSVYRYFFSGTQLTQEKFDYPEEISVLEDDWQQEWTSTYLPDSDAQDTCINSLKNNGKRRFTNIFKNQMIALDLNQIINNQSLQNIIKMQNVTAKIEFSSYKSNEGSCTINSKKIKRLKLNKLIIPANVDIAAITILAVSVIVK
ncbi:MAG: hypothetical protein KME52_24975 [Desmonostoc geniculatum HA4340-LM1]|jgi:hypothetical protein|nr:hypothetical protein [Desmonostoc geniculatum HA4340-LM1]